jgi:hypothetical protein
MNLDNQENYLKEQRLLNRLPINKLQKLVRELFKLRYEENDIEVDGYYRLASSVLIRRTSTGGTLIFHMKKFICVALLLFVCLTYNLLNK